MKDNRFHYLRCPYCGREGSHSKKVSKSVGLFRIKQLYGHILLMECMKCSKVCRIRKIGSVLQWEDMTPEEKGVHQKKSWTTYTKTKLKEDKNEQRI